MISASVYWSVLTRYTSSMDLQWIVKLIADGLVVPVVLIGAYALIKLVPNKEKYQVYSQVLMAGLTAYVAAKIIGSIYQPDQMRPFEILGVSAGASSLIIRVFRLITRYLQWQLLWRYFSEQRVGGWLLFV